eukprot:307344-Chlamydomonas_euryale.AAC.1
MPCGNPLEVRRPAAAPRHGGVAGRKWSVHTVPLRAPFSPVRLAQIRHVWPATVDDRLLGTCPFRFPCFSPATPAG